MLLESEAHVVLSLEPGSRKMNGVNLVNGNSHGTHLYRTEIVIFLQKGKRSPPIQVMSGPGRPATKVYSSNVTCRARDGIDIDCVNEKFQKGLDFIEKDGRYFLDLVNKESSRLENFCKTAEEEMTQNNIPEEGKVYDFIILLTLVFQKCVQTTNIHLFSTAIVIFSNIFVKLLLMR